MQLKVATFHDGWQDGVSGSLLIFWDWAVDWIVVEVTSWVCGYLGGGAVMHSGSW
jgi:hypothetical protein